MTSRKQRVFPFKGLTIPNGGTTNSYAAVLKVPMHNGDWKTIYLGSHVSQEAAARAYDRASWAFFRDKKRLNFPDEVPFGS